ncbi:DUF1801 domain-containing protein [Thalassospira sp.]|uniref:DUF1801 domain-containing protein n=1 Tax=Thalassospira sp. TaxID=1912094 RepID=UPI002736BBC1|nr:DUF1801 domain-containing protein [Thalassospira sp.]MDP2697613.1 DUF1801 domain-containing protein [Thalassospira sp.]
MTPPASPPPIQNPAITARYALYPTAAQERFHILRGWIYEVATGDPAIGPLAETVKWGEPSWRPISGGGTTLRLDWKDKNPNQIALYVNCQTSLIAEFRDMFDGQLQFEGNRAILLPLDQALPEDALKFCIAAILGYHRRKKGAPIHSRG